MLRLECDVAAARFSPDDALALSARAELARAAARVEGRPLHEAEFVLTEALDVARERLQLRLAVMVTAHRITGGPVAALH